MTDPNPQPQDIDVLRGLTPLPTQKRFLTCGAPCKVYIGPFGSGKTEVLCWQAILLSHWYTPNRGLIARFTFRELKDTTRRRFMEIADPRLVKHASLPETGDGYVEWKVGGVTLFRNLENPLHFGSLDLGYCGIDEITETPGDVYNHLEARVGRHWTRRSDWPYSPMFGVGNPGGQDHIWRLFFKPGRTEADRTRYVGFQPGPRENEANLPPSYYDSLARGKASWWIRRFLEGDMRSLEGLVWPQFDYTLNQVKPFPIPRNWNRYQGVDHGRRNPTAAQWWATDTEGNLICYRDYEVAGPTPAEHAREWLRIEKATGEKIQSRPADPSMFAKNQAGAGGSWHSVAEEYEEAGIDLEPGDNAMQASLDRCGSLLWADPRHAFPEWHPKAGQMGSPRAFFFETCERSIEEVSAWRFKDFRGAGLGLREEPVDVDDHLCDCFRYVATSFPEPSKVIKPKPVLSTDDWRNRRHWRLIRQSIRAAIERQKGYTEEDYV
jgi:hypothetical protein